MLNILFRLLAVLALFVGIIIGIGYLLPRSYDIEASIEIEAAPGEVFPMVNVIKNWQHWSTWNPETIPDLKITYEGNEAGVGSIQKWTDSRGHGELEITKSVPDEAIEYKMSFTRFPEMESEFQFKGNANKTVVTWSSSGELPSGAFYGYSGLLFEGQMQYEYERGLQKLKSIVESD